MTPLSNQYQDIRLPQEPSFRQLPEYEIPDSSFAHLFLKSIGSALSSIGSAAGINQSTHAVEERLIKSELQRDQAVFDIGQDPTSQTESNRHTGVTQISTNLLGIGPASLVAGAALSGLGEFVDQERRTILEKHLHQEKLVRYGNELAEKKFDYQARLTDLGLKRSGFIEEVRRHRHEESLEEKRLAMTQEGLVAERLQKSLDAERAHQIQLTESAQKELQALRDLEETKAESLRKDKQLDGALTAERHADSFKNRESASSLVNTYRAKNQEIAASLHIFAIQKFLSERNSKMVKLAGLVVIAVAAIFQPQFSNGVKLSVLALTAGVIYHALPEKMKSIDQYSIVAHQDAAGSGQMEEIIRINEDGTISHRTKMTNAHILDEALKTGLQLSVHPTSRELAKKLQNTKFVPSRRDNLHLEGISIYALIFEKDESAPKIMQSIHERLLSITANSKLQLEVQEIRPFHSSIINLINSGETILGLDEKDLEFLTFLRACTSFRGPFSIYFTKQTRSYKNKTELLLLDLLTTYNVLETLKIKEDPNELINSN